MAMHQLMSGDEKDALKTFKQAMQIDESSFNALTGIIQCQLLLNQQLEEAAQQLEFLTEIQGSIGRPSEVLFLSAQLAERQQADVDTILKKLDEAVEKHLASTAGAGLSEQMFVDLNPEFMLRMAKLYLNFGPTDSPGHADAASPILVKAARVLEAITKVAPGMLEAVYTLAYVRYLSGAVESAKSGVLYCLSQDNTFAEAHLLMARIHLALNNPRAAAQSIEIGLSYNFELRESPMYFLIQARIQQMEGKKEESARTLNSAMKLPGVRRAAAVGKKKGKRPITTAERVSVYLELSQAFRNLGQVFFFFFFFFSFCSHNPLIIIY